MARYTTEITSADNPAEKPLHERLRKAYVVAQDHIKGDALELGCGEGRGMDLLVPLADSYTAVDRYPDMLDQLSEKFPTARFINQRIPPLTGFESEAYDTVLSFQVIEHIKDDLGFLQEVYRVLKPGGRALISTPNNVLTLSRNPWHVREYVTHELVALCERVFDRVVPGGIAGNEKFRAYHEQNRQSVNHTMRWDVLDLQHRLPAWTLRVPYEILNRRNRKKLQHMDPSLVADISVDDYYYTPDPAGEGAVDLFFILEKAPLGE